MSYDPLQLCALDEASGKHVVDPAVMFPATIAHIQAVVRGEAQPVEIMTPGWSGRPDREPVADRFVKQAEAMPPGAWSLETDDRTRVLELAESWFKRALVLKVGRGIRLHIIRNDEYRRA
jgi:hypothetical protein